MRPRRRGPRADRAGPGQGEPQLATLTGALHPARSVLALGRRRDAVAEHLGGLLARAFGGHAGRWETFATLVDGFEGTVDELLSTVVALVDGAAAA